MKVLYIVGNRPQFIKLAILHQQAKQFPFIKEFIIHTGQHFSTDMSAVFFQDLAIEIPVINLAIHSLSHVAMVGRTMEALELEIRSINPDCIVVFGDTNATLAGALTGKKLNIPVVHIEAGIRTFDESMPEESNRYITDRISAINFCCTELGMQNLEKEGFTFGNIASQIINSGDLMLDAYHYYKQHCINRNILQNVPITKNKFVLATIHRKQNIDHPESLQHIVSALNEINKDIPVVCPLHPNTKQTLEKNGITCSFITLPPIGYFDMQHLLHFAQYVITDSGGLQREAFFAQKPTLILMEKPFWPEVMEHGCSINSLSIKEKIINNFADLKNLKKESDPSIFGTGNAAEIIIQTLIKKFSAAGNKSGVQQSLN
jgi:UDP-GlcNAc3NAcA epimerase